MTVIVEGIVIYWCNSEMPHKSFSDYCNDGRNDYCCP